MRSGHTSPSVPENLIWRVTFGCTVGCYVLEGWTPFVTSFKGSDQSFLYDTVFPRLCSISTSTPQRPCCVGLLTCPPASACASRSGCGLYTLHEETAIVYLEDYWPCAGRFSVVTAFGTELRDLIADRRRMTVLLRGMNRVW